VTRVLATINRQDCYERPPDWRWRRAGELYETGIGVRRHRDQTNMWKIFRFRRQLEMVNDPQRNVVLQNQYSDIHTAWSIYQDTENRGLKSEIEARILAQESFDDIAGKVAIAGGAATAYEQYFFNVTDRLSAPGYITHQIFGRSVQAGLAEREYDLLWKMYGYWCGPMVLDALIYKFNRPSRPETAESVSAHWIDDFKETVRMHGAIIMRMQPADWEKQMEIGNLFLRVLELDRNAGSSGGIGSEAILENVNAMMERLPWQKYDLGVRAPEEAATETEQIEMCGFSVRSAELAMFSIGKPPAELAHLIEGAVYPNPEDRENAQPNS